MWQWHTGHLSTVIQAYIRNTLRGASVGCVYLQNKQQMDMRIQKAVEANSKQAQKALDELKKKSAAELKKVCTA